MNLHEIDDGIFVSEQITVQDVETLKNAGFATIVCNRPDGEDAGQPIFREVQEKAHSLDIKIYYLPVVSQQIEPESVEAMSDIIENSARPLLAYCRSGGRSNYLYQLANDGLKKA